MGYYTKFDIEVHGKYDPEVYRKMVISLGGINPNYFANEDAEDLVTLFDYCDEMKWYDYDDDMKALNILYPDYIFELHGEDEESGDLWNAYYRDGKSQKCQALITYPEPDLYFTTIEEC